MKLLNMIAPGFLLLAGVAGTPAMASGETCPNACAASLQKAFLLGRQEYGETRLDSAIEGTPLTVAGTRYERGIGTHAASMIPLDVPESCNLFFGAVGMDDRPSGASDGAEFRVISGTETLWSSGVMKRGDPAKKFEVVLPTGVSKIYLLTLSGKHNNADHADWLDLRFAKGNRVVPVPVADQVFSGKDFGLVPGGNAESGDALRKALGYLRSVGGGVLDLEKGEYHFYAKNGHEMTFWISNHSQQEMHRVAIPLVDLKNVTLRGNGSTFIFHGKCITTLFMDCENVALEGVRIDFARALDSEAKVLGFENGKTVVSIDPKEFPYEIEDGKEGKQLAFLGEDGQRMGFSSAIAFRKGSKNIVARTADIGCKNQVEVRPDGTFLLNKDFSKEGVGVEVGDTLTLRTWQRPAPACVIYRAKDTTLRDVSIHSSFGMGVLAQRSENITITGTRTAADKTSGAFPREETGRSYSTTADATHFSNVRGKILVENSFFETMLDDAINVHSTCLDIAEIPAPNTLKCRYRHGQAIGFELFLPGETLRFIAGKTLENGALVKVKSARRISPQDVIIEIEGDVPAGVVPGDAVENADFQPEVVFRGNIVQNNRARGALFTTPKKVLVEKNLFRDVAGSAILLAGDAQGWYESGACEDVLIRDNVFENNLTSSFQFTEAVISIYPEVRDLAAQKKFYHRNVVIADNVFRTFDVPLLFAISTEDLTFADNRIFMNDDFPGFPGYWKWEKKKTFRFKRCADVKICGNEIAEVGSDELRPQTWTIDDCVLELTDPKEISFTK